MAEYLRDTREYLKVEAVFLFLPKPKSTSVNDVCSQSFDQFTRPKIRLRGVLSRSRMAFPLDNCHLPLMSSKPLMRCLWCLWCLWSLWFSMGLLPLDWHFNLHAPHLCGAAFLALLPPLSLISTQPLSGEDEDEALFSFSSRWSWQIFNLSLMTSLAKG